MHPPLLALVEDDPSLCELLNEVFTAAGYRTLVLMNGAGAHPAIRHAQPDLIVLDPYRSHQGIEWPLLEQLGTDPATRPIPIEAIRHDLTAQTITLSELHIDRVYLSSVLVRERAADLTVYCRAWPVHNGAHFPKTAFALDWEQGTIRCPNAVVLPFAPQQTVQLPAATCTPCPLRERCTSSASGRSVAIHPDERLLADLCDRQLTAVGRAKVRERVGVEHALAHIGHWQGDRARYWGVRKNLFDLRRCAVVHTLHVLARWDEEAQAA